MDEFCEKCGGVIREDPETGEDYCNECLLLAEVKKLEEEIEYMKTQKRARQ